MGWSMAANVQKPRAIMAVQKYYAPSSGTVPSSIARARRRLQEQYLDCLAEMELALNYESTAFDWLHCCHQRSKDHREASVRRKEHGWQGSGSMVEHETVLNYRPHPLTFGLIFYEHSEAT